MPFEYLETDEFLRDFLERKERAHDAFFHCYWKKVRLFATKLIGDETYAKDIVMESFVKLYNSGKPFESVKHIRFSLYLTVRNACFDYLKSRQRVSLRERTFQSLVNDDPDLENSMMHGEVMESLYTAFNNLPEEYKQVIKLIYVNRLKYQEVADHLGISVPSVKARRKAGINKLRLFMESEKHLIAVLTFHLAAVLQHH